MEQVKVVYISNVLPELFAAGAPEGWHVVTLGSGTSDEECLAEARDADFLVLSQTGHPKLPFPEQIVYGPKLKLLQPLGQGMDYMPVRAALKRGIRICNCGGGNSVPVTEHAILLILAVMRGLPQRVQEIREGKWSTQLKRTSLHTLHGKTVGFVGFGNIGQKIAARVRAFGTDIIFIKRGAAPQAVVADLHARRVALEELLSTADVVIVCVPLTEGTERMIGWKQLTMMKPSAYLINISRGGVVDERALIRALREKKIGGAGIDVFDREPTDPDNPLLHMDNVVATAHMSAAAAEYWLPRIKNLWDNILRVHEGRKPENIVTSV